MGLSSGEIGKVSEEISGCIRGGERYREKRQSISEGPAAIEVRCRKENPHGTK